MRYMDSYDGVVEVGWVSWVHRYACVGCGLNKTANVQYTAVVVD